MAVEFDKKAAILIGVNTYDHVTPLQFCRDDAAEFARVLQETLGFKSDDILQMIEGSEYPPTRGTIFHCLGELKKVKKVGKDDLLLFFFSGHGMTGDEDGKDYLLPSDATPFNLEQTAIKIEDIAKELKKTDCNNIVMFIDACRNLGEKSVTSIGQEAADAVRRAGIVTFFSCDPKQKSYEIETLKHGSFTHCILEAITKNEGSSVSALDAYLRKRVPEINKQYKKPDQEPYTIIEPIVKGQLQIFFSAVQKVQTSATIEVWKSRLAYLFSEEQINVDLLNKTFEYLNLNKENVSFERDQRTVLIKAVCDETLLLDAFIAAWGTIERKTAKPKPKTSLGNL
ncbi:MAG TPA: caspase family protein [Thermoanaerobaculia bacterium]|nr:caspase family protein [Thermoanaerobaculia bacterium]